MLLKIVLLIALIVVLASLGSALYQMIRYRGGEKMVRALTVRVAVSVAVIVLLIVAAALGWITPHGLAPVPAG